MARFDVHPLKRGHVLDCRSDLLSDLSTRFGVPLTPPDDAPFAAVRLTPDLDVGNERLVMVAQLATTLHAREIGPAIASPAVFQPEIMNALDMLLTGY